MAEHGQHRVGSGKPPISDRPPAFPPAAGDDVRFVIDRRLGFSPTERARMAAQPATRTSAAVVLGLGAALTCIAIIRCIVRPRH